jgi:hypothetical protein
VNRVLVTRAGAVLAGIVVIAVLSGGAIVHVVLRLYCHLEASMAGRPFEGREVSKWPSSRPLDGVLYRILQSNFGE